MPRHPADRYQTIEWLKFQTSGIGPLFGQVGFFNKFAGKNYQDKRPRDRYGVQSRRLLHILSQRLEQRAGIMGDAYGIADIAPFPWTNNLIGFYKAADLVGIADYPHLTRALQAFRASPAVTHGLNSPPRS